MSFYVQVLSPEPEYTYTWNLCLVARKGKLWQLISCSGVIIRHETEIAHCPLFYWLDILVQPNHSWCVWTDRTDCVLGIHEEQERAFWRSWRGKCDWEEGVMRTLKCTTTLSHKRIASLGMFASLELRETLYGLDARTLWLFYPRPAWNQLYSSQVSRMVVKKHPRRKSTLSASTPSHNPIQGRNVSRSLFLPVFETWTIKITHTHCITIVKYVL